MYNNYFMLIQIILYSGQTKKFHFEMWHQWYIFLQESGGNNNGALAADGKTLTGDLNEHGEEGGHGGHVKFGWIQGVLVCIIYCFRMITIIN